MTDPLGQSQVLPYLKGLASEGYSIHLISFEKPDRFAANEKVIRGICKDADINWHPLNYTKRPPLLSTLWDLRRMKSLALRLHKEHNFKLIHCRSYISAIVGLHFKRKLNIPFLFDMRGFWADERVDGGIWSLSNPVFKKVYHFFKKKEKEFFRESDHIISLTENGKQEIINEICPEISSDKITVIPCCVDLELFNPKKITSDDQNDLRKKLGISENTFILGYVGSIGTWYMLPEMLDYFKTLKQNIPDSKFLFVTGEAPESIINQAKHKDIAQEDLIITSCLHKEVPLHISLFSAGIFFIRPTYSKKASSPTKQGELMALGIPVVCNSGVGDSDLVVKTYHSGLLIESFTRSEYENNIIHPQDFNKSEITDGANKFFSLDEGTRRYSGVYKCLIE